MKNIYITNLVEKFNSSPLYKKVIVYNYLSHLCPEVGIGEILIPNSGIPYDMTLRDETGTLYAPNDGKYYIKMTIMYYTSNTNKDREIDNFLLTLDDDILTNMNSLIDDTGIENIQRVFGEQYNPFGTFLDIAVSNVIEKFKDVNDVIIECYNTKASFPTSRTYSIEESEKSRKFTGNKFFTIFLRLKEDNDFCLNIKTKELMKRIESFNKELKEDDTRNKQKYTFIILNWDDKIKDEESMLEDTYQLFSIDTSGKVVGLS